MTNTLPDAQPEPLEPLLLSPSELARYLSVSVRTLWRMRDAGELPAPIKIGRLVRWRKEAVDHWFRETNPTTPEVIEEAAKKFKDHRRRSRTHKENDKATDYKANKGN